MNQKIRHIGLAALVAVAAASGGRAQTGRSGGSSHGYASDTFEGFAALDADTRIPQKNKSFWFSVSGKTPEAQLQYARQQEAAGHDRSARKGYEALVREWPTAPEAAQAQLALAQLQERRQKFEKAFDEYQYLLVHYAGHCPYQDVLDRQFRIANHLLHNNTSMFGWNLSGSDAVRERFEQLVRNAPRGAQAPEIMMTIGGIRESDKELPEAIAVYEGLLNRFPQSDQAVAAAYLAAQCRHELAVKHNYNEPRCREAIGFIKAVLARMPRHPQKEQLSAWLSELSTLLVEQNYQQAVFYDTRQRNAEAAKTAYRRFLSEFSESRHAQHVRDRLAELEKGAAPLK
ncbi:MAG: tetratricopeptide repeat protein [Verrucomicrobiota bacterium]|jgi:outer membrane protein assembly factor BamD (BamD/ComL family)|nr:tetratricopeptide repeat protein [Verrucomicrobiota bacterium]